MVGDKGHFTFGVDMSPKWLLAKKYTKHSYIRTVDIWYDLWYNIRRSVMDQRLHQIAERLGRDEMLLQLAEECSELSQACLKMVRANKGLTPKTVDECKDSLAEELSDVKVCMELVESLVTGLQSKQEFYREYKTDRWHKRTFLGQDKA